MNEQRLSIADFLTDGSLAALCQSISELARARVTLRDRDGHRIVRVLDPHDAAVAGVKPWRIWQDEADDRAIARRIEAFGSAEPRAHDGARAGEADPGQPILVPLRVAGQPIGAIVIEPHDDHPLAPESRQAIRRFAELLASTVGELCEGEVQLRRRHAELNVLYQLSTLLVTARDVQAILQVALRSAISIFKMDAGTVHLLDDSRTTLELAAHAGLSDRFVAEFTSVPADAARDRGALHGQVIVVTDQSVDPLIRKIEAIRQEGLVGRVSCGLEFKGRAFGLVRLYSRAPASMDEEARALLKTISDQVAAAVATAELTESDRKRRQMQRQLQLAADVQRRMLPAALPDFPTLDIAPRYISSLELGGDFYDLIPLGGHLGVVLGDVVGKGVAAALLMASVRASLRAHAEGTYHLDQVMQRVNRALVHDTLDKEFATIFFGVIDPRSLRLTYCNAGHEPPMIVRAELLGAGRAPTPDNCVVELTTGGMVVGVDDAQRYERGIFDLRPGDCFVGYTDGITDAMNFDGEKFGRRRLKDALLDMLTENPRATAKTIADHIIWSMRRFIGMRPAIDDSTLVVIRAGSRG